MYQLYVGTAGVRNAYTGIRIYLGIKRYTAKKSWHITRASDRPVIYLPDCSAVFDFLGRFNFTLAVIIITSVHYTYNIAVGMPTQKDA